MSWAADHPGWITQALGMERLAYLTEQVVVRVPSTARALAADGGGCSCHISPPCDFCLALLEPEVEAFINHGMAGLEALWARADEWSDHG